tara:strand:+ start:1543 stop:2109 length:567 start_codon:yes stop_codon:yes gene_type:complete
MKSFAYENGNPNTGVSLCISHVYCNISTHRIKSAFIKANLGFIERIDVVPVYKGESYNKVFVHFKAGCWNLKDKNARSVLTRLQKGEQVIMVYDNPWFWKLSLSNSKRSKKTFDPKQPLRRKQILDLETVTEKETNKENSKKVRFSPKTTVHHFNYDVEGIKNEVTHTINSHKLNLNDPIQARIANHM